jgi:hypothetical protein
VAGYCEYGHESPGSAVTELVRKWRQFIPSNIQKLKNVTTWTNSLFSRYTEYQSTAATTADSSVILKQKWAILFKVQMCYNFWGGSFQFQVSRREPNSVPVKLRTTKLVTVWTFWRIFRPIYKSTARERVAPVKCLHRMLQKFPRQWPKTSKYAWMHNWGFKPPFYRRLVTGTERKLPSGMNVELEY